MCQMLAIFQELNSKGLYLNSEKQKENRCLVFTSSTKRDITKSHVIVVQWSWRQGKIQKKRAARAKLLFETYCFFTVLVDVAVAVA